MSIRKFRYFVFSRVLINARSRSYYRNKYNYLRTLQASEEKRDKHLLIVNLGNSFDYVLLRNFIRSIWSSKKYASFCIDLLADFSCRDIAVGLDGKLIRKFFWTRNISSRSQGNINPLELVKLKLRGFKTHYHTVIFGVRLTRIQ